MEKLHVSLRENSYHIMIGSGAFAAAVEDAAKNPLACCIITDSNFKRLLESKIAETIDKLRRLGGRTDVVSFPAGERSKSLATVSGVCEEMASKGLGRDTTIIALGGGVVGDLAGFVAAIYCRGVPYAQVPTTLLAMVDSSIGGKVGVDLATGKNLVGAFYQPEKVYIDTDFLKTLSRDELSNGLAEIIKCAAIADNRLFACLEKNLSLVFRLEERALTEIITRCCLIKKSVVEQDEKESGLRMILNFGHTVAHAVERLSGYSISHGEAVAIGMAVEAEISRIKGLIKSEEVERLKALIRKAGLPTHLPHSYSYRELSKAMQSDKKARKGKPRFVLLKKIGKVANHRSDYTFEVEEEILKEAVERCMRRKN